MIGREEPVAQGADAGSAPDVAGVEDEDQRPPGRPVSFHAAGLVIENGVGHVADRGGIGLPAEPFPDLAPVAAEFGAGIRQGSAGARVRIVDTVERCRPHRIPLSGE